MLIIQLIIQLRVDQKHDFYTKKKKKIQPFTRESLAASQLLLWAQYQSLHEATLKVLPLNGKAFEAGSLAQAVKCRSWAPLRA